jgi:diacylglycerol kinase (ATP)
VNVLSAGIGGLVDRYVASLPDRLGGRPAYMLATLAALAACRRRRLACRATSGDGDTIELEFEGFAVAVCNGHTFGGGMRIAPGALVDDGLFDVVTIERRSRVTMLKDFASIYSGTHLTKRGVRHLVCRHLELAPSAPPGAGRTFPLDVDGEPLGDVPLVVDVLPGALTVLA